MEKSDIEVPKPPSLHMDASVDQLHRIQPLFHKAFTQISNTSRAANRWRRKDLRLSNRPHRTSARRNTSGEDCGGQNKVSSH
eukprot:1191167-Prorocentrum_minimum.AAC.2